MQLLLDLAFDFAHMQQAVTPSPAGPTILAFNDPTPPGRAWVPRPRQVRQASMMPNRDRPARRCPARSPRRSHGRAAEGSGCRRSGGTVAGGACPVGLRVRVVRLG